MNIAPFNRLSDLSLRAQPCVQGLATATAAIVRNGSPALSSLAAYKSFSTRH